MIMALDVFFHHLTTPAGSVFCQDDSHSQSLSQSLMPSIQNTLCKTQSCHGSAQNLPGVLRTLGVSMTSFVGAQGLCSHEPLSIHTCLPLPMNMLSTFLVCLSVCCSPAIPCVLSRLHTPAAVAHYSSSLLREAVLGQP